MNKDNAHEYLPLIYALANGKTIQYNDEGDWCDVDVLMTHACDPSCYRIKPKPRTFEIVKSELTDSIYSAKDWDGSYPNIWERITVKEVLT